ncbi:MAG TPA: hypothetical protein VLK84_04040 [Longimicrobium sp.]|nr:hypothetical protein [Longimicrobium sp.]
MKLTTGLLALLLDYVGQDHCGCRDAGSCIHCVASRALDEAETSLPAEFAEANSLSGPAVCRRFEAPLVPSEPAAALPLPLPRVFVAKAHSGSPHHAPDNCDFALVRVAPELAQVLLAYRDALDCLAAGVRHRFSDAASVSHELKLFPPCWVDFVASAGLGLPDGDPLQAAVESVIESDTVVALPAAVDVSGYDLGEVTARTDIQHCRVSGDGVTFAAYAGDTIVSATTIGWDEIVAVWGDRSRGSGA